MKIELKGLPQALGANITLNEGRLSSRSKPKKKRHITAREKELGRLGISAKEYVKRSGSGNRTWLEKQKGFSSGSNPLGIDIKSFKQRLKKTVTKKKK